MAEPEHGLFADGGVVVALGDFDKFGDAFVFGHLTEGEDGFLFYFGVGIVVDGVGDGGGGFFAGFLRDPEESLSANVRAFVVVSHPNHFVDGAGFAAATNLAPSRLMANAVSLSSSALSTAV